MMKAPLKSPAEIVRTTSELLKPGRRIRPSEAAAQWLRTEKGGWDPALTPMMVEPLDLLAGREYTGIVFVGPARSGKTMSLLLAGVTYVVTCAPDDTLIVQMSQDAARDFSRMDLDRAIRHSPELAARLSSRARDDNTFDKFWRSGIVLKLGWPAVSQLSSKTLRYVMMTDYDRPGNRDDVDGEGPLWDLGAKRVETYMSRGKVLAESSPGGEYLDGHWKPSTPHEGPPAQGIVSLYNRGTRARWYWPCLHCGEHFQAEPGLGNFALPKFDEIEKLVQTEDLSHLADEWSKIVCRRCGTLHQLSDRPAMNAAGRWLHEGQAFEAGAIVGERRRSQIASYWLGGVAAAYQRWDSILLKYLQAVRTFVTTKDESPLKATTNTDQAAPYLPRVAANKRGAEHLLERLESWPRGLVPSSVRFLTAAVDVQGNRFVVQVYGWGAGLECWIVDRFVVSSSHRQEGDRTAALDPASYVEDWEVLQEQVISRSYALADDASRALEVALTCCDSGGREGVTEKAYEFWRRLRNRGLGRRFVLVKGDGNMNSPRIRETWPDSKGRRDRTLGQGDVPVWFLNVNVLKDGIVGDLAREMKGPGYVHIPRWIEPEFFQEITAETRTERGWVRPNTGVRNEAFDLHVYARAACILLAAEAIDWDHPPEWASPPKERAAPAKVPRGRRVRSRGVN